jgi:uncharacterized repeat protein (TIGR02543 family)
MVSILATLVVFSLPISCNNGTGPGETYTLTVNANPISGGTVTINPDKADYNAGEQVTVTASANSGYTFTRWSGASTATTASVTITMDNNKTLTARFGSTSEPDKYTLNVSSNPAAGGTITINPDKANYSAGEQVTVTAIANSGYTFDKWSGASTATSASVNITMDSNKTLTAMFKENSGVEPVPGSDLRIYVNKTNNTFEVDGKRIWINGANTPWDKWNDFGGGYNSNFWDAEFGRLRDAGINATRVWINCNGYGSINISTDGTVSGVTTNNHWSHLDSFFNLAKKHKIYIMATLTSFDHFKSGNEKSDRWRAMLRSKTASESFANNYTKTFVNKYKDNPYLWSIDLMNEPEWVSVDETDNAVADRIAWANLQYFFAYNTRVIHENSDILVTVGIASTKYNGGESSNGNKVSDAALKTQVNDTKACLDFWSPHYYDWVGEWYGVPHYLTPSGARGGNKNSGWTGGWGLDGSKPAVLGECSAKGTTPGLWGTNSSNTIITDFESAYTKGWQGVMPWTSNGVDSNGNLTNFSPATLNMKTKYPALIYPWD